LFAGAIDKKEETTMNPQKAAFMSRHINIELLVGLPGSGKSTYAKERANEKDTAVADIDAARERLFGSAKQDINACVREAMRRVKNNAKTIIVDGLFLTNDDRIKAITAVASYYGACRCIIHLWNEARDICLKNDGGRRETSAAQTIQNAVYEPVDVERIQAGIADCNATLIDVQPHKVELKPGWERLFRPHVWIEDGKMRSTEWCAGGAYGNCWDDSKSPVAAEDPLPFKELDDLLLKIVPELSFLQYRKIQNECVTSESRYESDYYGGGCSYAYWVCDLKKMYDILEEFYPGLCNRDNIEGDTHDR
jgi:predicted kinase